eukprot:TRINITY_DN94433_c0_g1_i1.p1 TRINITY_DN94433_c0_g1~~TRINITY_DN94433_c0_g1_i1.p1  ORF type:complete len:726 (+),score=92.36 TRINITY_DN94433_c0_g1_i1:34-2211(+)
MSLHPTWDGPVWTKRQRLSFPPPWGWQQGAQAPEEIDFSSFGLPLYLCHGDCDDAVLTSAEGERETLPVCEDVLYQALDHRLFWVKAPRSGHVFFYSQVERGAKPEPDEGAAAGVLQIFKTWDINGDGIISETELCSVLAEVGIEEQKARRMFESADMNSDGQIDYAEFVHWVYHGDIPSELRQRLLGQSGLTLMQAEATLPLADFFRDDVNAILSRWVLQSDVKHNPAAKISIRNFGDDAPTGGRIGQAIAMDTVAGYIALGRSLSFSSTEGSRLHLRAHFFDDGEEYSATGHWLGLQSGLGTASIGLGFAMDGCYSVLNGKVAGADIGKYYRWTRTSVDRTAGWHLFEIVLEEGEVKFIIDSELVLYAPAEGGTCDGTEVWLYARCGGAGVWAGVELFYLPKPEHAEPRVRPGGRYPWVVHTEKGRWQADDQGILQSVLFERGAVAFVTPCRQRLIDSFSRVPRKYPYLPGMDSMLGKTYKIIAMSPDGMVGLPAPDYSDDDVWWFPPRADAVVVAMSAAQAAVAEREAQAAQPEELPIEETVEAPEAVEEPPPVEEPPAATDLGGLNIECWTIPTEDDVSRIDRVMGSFLTALRDAEYVMPDNIRRLQSCRAEGHSSCLVYRFGTRRVHVATRGEEGGRLSVVVRVGGGYMDFVEFVRRHGHIEHLRLQKQRDREGRDVVRCTSVMTGGKVKAVASRSRATSPSGSAGRRPSRPPSPSRAAR